MRKIMLAAGCLIAALLPGQASAGPYADTLGRCAIQATSADDRKAMVR